MTTVLDHLVVAADSLGRGVDHVEQCLGVRCGAGGRHPRMGTHNALLGLGHGCYLEVIAIDPDASAPATPRWFGLDDRRVARALRERPRLLTWVARTTDLDATLAACPYTPGRARAMERGDLHWRIAFPDDGKLLGQGLLPPLIEWGTDTAHPAERLPDRGLRLGSLYGVHPKPAPVRAALAAIGLDDALAIEPAPPGRGARLQAEIQTPRGPRWLD